jgi:cyclophilin family peptidyl-prolyl cis-trans isomerase
MIRPLLLGALAGCAALPAPTADLVAVVCTTTKGPLKITINQAWAPVGAQRFLDLLDDNFFDEHPLYRAVDNFLVQFGMAADPQLTQKWTQETITDDPDPQLQFRPGVLCFAGSGPNSRDTSLFLATSTNPGQLAAFGENLWERPLGYVTEGLDVLLNFYTGYGDMAEQGGQGPSQSTLSKQGTTDLGFKAQYPKLDYLIECHRGAVTEADAVAVALDSWPRSEREVPEDELDDEEPVETEVMLVNSAGEPLDVYFQPKDGDSVFKARLESGQPLEQATYVGHTFLWTKVDSPEVLHTTEIEAGKAQYHAEL